MTKFDTAKALGQLPQGLRDELMDEYGKVTKNYARRHWEAAELGGGRFCEIVYSVLKGRVDGVYPQTASKPQNFPKSCEALSQADKATFPQSVRIGIPRVLVGLYEIRNNRGVGHVGGDVNANHMDATYVLHATQWVMAEMVRLFHDLDVTTATGVVNALTDRTLPMIWKISGKRRILDNTLTLGDQVLLLLYGDTSGIPARELARDLKQSRFANFKRVLKRLDEAIMVEYDEISEVVEISPKGEKTVEERLLSKLTFD